MVSVKSPLRLLSRLYWTVWRGNSGFRSKFRHADQRQREFAFDIGVADGRGCRLPLAQPTARGARP